MTFEQQLPKYQKQVEQALDRWLPTADTAPAKLHRAMRYAVLNGGKRVRPLLAYATTELLQLNPQQVDTIACAIELIHCYSMVHDDLPAMDDDDLRRGQPTVHKAFDEATAILVGDALQALAFEIIACDPLLTEDAEARACMLACLAKSAGSVGMCGGQALDIEAESRQLDLTELETIHKLKTGQLIRAAVIMPCYLDREHMQTTIPALEEYAHCVGLAFQVRDDILDIEGDTEVIGKTQGSDVVNEKATYPALLGLAKAKQLAEDLYTRALTSLEPFNQHAAPLKWLAEFIVKRDH